MVHSNKSLVFIINVDWYFALHWVERAEYFKGQGYNIHIVSRFTDSSIKQKLIDSGFHCHHIDIQRKSINLYQELKSLYSLKVILDTIEPDLIHCVTVKPNIYVGILNRLLIKAPIIYSVTGLGIVFSSSHLKYRILRKVIVQLYKLVSTNKSRFIFENGDDHKLFIEDKVISNGNGIVIKGAGIDLNRFKASTLPNNRDVLFAARLLKDKGLHTLVEAKRILAKQGVNFSLKVAGIIDTDVSTAIPIEEIKQWDEAGEITWLGNVANMPDLIKSCDIVCLPTTYGEGVPRILIEAASCQRAIITTDVVGCREIVSDGQNGFLVEPNSPQSLASALGKLLTDKSLLSRFGEQGRVKVESEFSQEHVFEQTRQVYEQLLALR